MPVEPNWYHNLRDVEHLPVPTYVDYEYRGQAADQPPTMPGFPPVWPDARGFIPTGPQMAPPTDVAVNNGPVISHVNIYLANDSQLTQALSDYDFLFRDDKRVTGWQTVLSNRAEFIAFCCRLHIWETFMARGGAGQAEKVRRMWKPWHGERPY